MKLFPFSLKDEAKNWLNSLRPRSIGNWQEMQTEFLKKNFPIHRTNALKREIIKFSHHGNETWRVISIFYESLTPKMLQFVEMMCNGEFLNKNPDEAFDYFYLLAENAQSWDTANTSDRSRASTNPSRGGKYQLREDNDLCARVASLTRKLEARELRKVNGINTVPKIDEVCRICETMEHHTNECPTILAFKEVLHDQANTMNMVKKSYPSPYSETYHSGWRIHPNFSWRIDNVVAPPTHGSLNFVPYNSLQRIVLRTLDESS